MPIRAGFGPRSPVVYGSGKSRYTYNPKTRSVKGPGKPVAPAPALLPHPALGPLRSQSSNPRINPAIAQRAEATQAHLVSQYVTKAYSSHLEKQGFSMPEIDLRIQQDSAKLSAERDHLLSHPAVQAANSEGKIVTPKGLSKLETFQRQINAVEGPHGVAHTKRFGLVPRSLRLGPQGEKEMAAKQPYEGSVGRTLALARAKAQTRSEPSTLEDLTYASIGIPGIGVGGDIARVGELAAETVPKLLAEGGARQVARDVGTSIATKAAGARAAAQAAARAPGDALDALRAAPEALRGAPKALRGALKATPEATRAAAKAAPGATLRYGAKAAETNAHAVSGLAVLSTAHKAGLSGPLDIPGRASAFLKGTGAALEHNPGGTLETTGRAIPGFITAPADVVLSAGQSAVEGNPKRFTSTVSNLAKGTGQIVGELASGDPHTVQGSIEHKVGLTPFIPAPAVLAKLHGSDLYTEPRGAVRRAVENRRAKGRENTPTEKAVKQPVPVSGRPGEHYVLRGIGSKIENTKARKQVALDTTRAGMYGETHGGIEASKIINAGRGKAGNLSRLADKMGAHYEAAVSPMAQYGIPHTPEGQALMSKLAEFYGQSKELPPRGALNARMAAEAAAKEPKLFGEGRHAALTQAYRESAGRLSKLSSHSSARAERIPQNDFTNYLRAKEGLPRVLKPEERITARAHQFTSPEEAAKALRDQASTLRERAGKLKDEAKATALTDQAKALESHAGELVRGKMVSREGAWAHYGALNAEYDALRKAGQHEAARTILAQKKGLHGELKDYTRPEHNLDRSERQRWSRAMVRDFAKEQDAVAKGYGLHQGVYVKDVAPRSAVTKGALVERPFSSRATHVKTGALAKSGEGSARFEDLMQHSVLGPRTRIAYNELVHNTLNEGKMPVRVGDTYKHVLNEKELREAEHYGHFPDNGTAVPIGVIKQALTGEHALSHEGVSTFLEHLAKGGQEGAARALESLPADLRDEVLARQGEKGTKYAVINSAKLNELVEQFKTPQGLAAKLRTAASVPSRIILNDPAWVLSQLLAKGIPIHTALGPQGLLRAPQAIKVMAEIQKMDPEKQARIASIVGSSMRLNQIPHGAFEAAHDPFSNVRALRHSSAGRKLWNLANGNVLTKFDRWNEAKLREYAAAVRASKGFRNWYGGFKGMNADMAKVAEATKGMKPSERLDYISQHPDLARAVQKDLNRMGGNWNSFTALERKVAPFAMFYPWIRYSIDWVFHVFPLDHPVAATTLAMLAQVNANGLQKLAAEEAKKAGIPGITPETPLADALDYSYPLTFSGNKGQVFPVGPRISPSLGVLGSTVTSGNPISLLGGLNMPLATGISVITGTNLLSGEKFKASRGDELLNQILSASPFVRLLEHEVGFRGFGKGPQSALSKAYEQANPGKVNRSVLFPFTPQKGRNFALENALSRVEEIISNTSSSKQKEVQGNERLTVQARQKRVSQMKEEEKAAIEAREKILAAINPALKKQAAAEYERYSQAGKGTTSIFGNVFGKAGSSPFSNIFGQSSGSESLFGGSASKYKPPKEGLHLPHVSIPGLGAIGGLLGSLVGGTPAQAATLPKGKKGISLSGPLTPSQKTFGKELSRRTGLAPKTVGGWLLAEESGSAAASKEAKGDANWLNIGPGANLGSDPKAAARETANLINSSGYYAGIRGAVGKGVQAQVSAIKASPWDAGHYANGIPTDLVSGSGKGLPKRVMTRFRAGATAAAELNRAHLPYVWGGGHVSGQVKPTGGGLDCSGTVSYVLQRMGVKLPGGVVSGEMGHYLKSGPGAVTVFYNAQHTFMKIGNRYFGTSNSNPQGGPGFFSNALGRSMAESGTYAVGHVAGLGKKVAVALGVPLTGQSFPGMTLSSNGTSATINPGAGATVETPGFSTKPISAAQRLSLAEHVSRGDLRGYGVPGISTTELSSLGKRMASSEHKVSSAAHTLENVKAPLRIPGMHAKGNSKLPIPLHHSVVKAPKVGLSKVTKAPKLSVPHAVNSSPRLTPLPKPKKARGMAVL